MDNDQRPPLTEAVASGDPKANAIVFGMILENLFEGFDDLMTP
jgi:hypothetical protein